MLANSVDILNPNTTGLIFAPGQQVRMEHLQVGISPDYQVQATDRLHLSLKLPLSYSDCSVRRDAQRIRDIRPLFTPSLSATYRVNSRWELYARAHRSFVYADEGSLLTSPYL